MTTRFQKLCRTLSQAAIVDGYKLDKTEHTELDYTGDRNLLLVLAAGMVLLATENFIAIGFAWFAFLIGLGLIMMAALSSQDQKKETSTQRLLALR